MDTYTYTPPKKTEDKLIKEPCEYVRKKDENGVWFRVYNFNYRGKTS